MVLQLVDVGRRGAPPIRLDAWRICSGLKHHVHGRVEVPDVFIGFGIIIEAVAPELAVADEQDLDVHTALAPIHEALPHT